MNLYLSKILKREEMKKISLIILGFFMMFNLYAEENMENIDKLDMLDKQSKEFFNAITGLEKNYLEEQVNAIKNKKEDTSLNPNQNSNVNSMGQIIKEERKMYCDICAEKGSMQYNIPMKGIFTLCQKNTIKGSESVS